MVRAATLRVHLEPRLGWRGSFSFCACGSPRSGGSDTLRPNARGAPGATHVHAVAAFAIEGSAASKVPVLGPGPSRGFLFGRPSAGRHLAKVPPEFPIFIPPRLAYRGVSCCGGGTS